MTILLAKQSGLLQNAVMSTLIIKDTYKVIQMLQEQGFSADQAKGITQALQQLDSEDLATKQYVAEKISAQTWQLIGFMVAQAAVIVTLVKLF